jgi:hypothetical protein
MTGGAQDLQPGQVEPLGEDHSRGYLSQILIRGVVRYLRVRDENDETERQGDYV